MCIGAPKVPDVPSPPERQVGKLPDGGSSADRSDFNAKRRRALMATIIAPQGLGAPATTASATLGG